jgi:hypothetical protein
MQLKTQTLKITANQKEFGTNKKHYTLSKPGKLNSETPNALNL